MPDLLALPDVALLERLDFETPCDGCDQPAAKWARFTRCDCDRDLLLFCTSHYTRLRPVLYVGARWQCTICSAPCRVQAIGRLR